MKYPLCYLLSSFALVTAFFAVETQEVYRSGPKSYDGTGKYYMGREISQVMGHLGATWLERPGRVKEERTDLLIRNLDLEKHHNAADIGAGTGFFSFPMSAMVTEGKVFAVDIQEEMLDIIRKRMKERGTTNIVPTLGTVEDTKLPEGELDLVLLVDAYHEFSHPREMMLSIVKGLRKGGRVVLIEYREEDPEVRIKPRHKMSQDQAKEEMAAVGLEWKETKDFLPKQHFMVFIKP
jgi:ubiquinone/menaquinone biosynthesis C-methylase UbiE